jgi:hypothetical protein
MASDSRITFCVMLLEIREDSIVGRLDAEQEHLESRLLELVQERAASGDVDSGLDDEFLLDPVGDDQVAQLLGAPGVREQIVIAEQHHVGSHGLEFLDDRPMGRRCTRVYGGGLRLKCRTCT